jgi:hypothetical protein
MVTDIKILEVLPWRCTSGFPLLLSYEVLRTFVLFRLYLLSSPNSLTPYFINSINIVVLHKSLSTI